MVTLRVNYKSRNNYLFFKDKVVAFANILNLGDLKGELLA